MFRITPEVHHQLIAASLAAYPLEACGLLAGPPADGGRPGDVGELFVPCHNDDQSARVYTVNPNDFMAAESLAEERGWEINGVVHSHTHSEPYPSPTDVAAVVSAEWHYVIVGLKRDTPEVRSYRMVDGEIEPEALVVGSTA